MNNLSINITQENFEALKFDLEKVFEGILVKEIDTNGKSYYNVVLSKYKANEAYKNMGLCLFIDKADLKTSILDSVNWFYLVNPSSATSNVIKRKSEVHMFSKDVADILEKKQLDPVYVSENLYTETKPKTTPLYIYESITFNDFFITNKGFGKDVESNVLVIDKSKLNSLLEKSGVVGKNYEVFKQINEDKTFEFKVSATLEGTYHPAIKLGIDEQLKTLPNFVDTIITPESISIYFQTNPRDIYDIVIQSK